MPELVLGGSPTPATPPSALLDSIDCALKSYAAPTLHSLKIEVSGVGRRDVPAHRISPWLRFASQRLAGELCLRLRVEDAGRYDDISEDLALPICERATEMYLLTDFDLRPPPPTGSFSALTCLMISCGHMDGGELGRFVSFPQCPHLQKLYISVTILEAGVSICSESLQYLYYSTGAVNTGGMLQANAPMLQEICVSSRDAKACIVAPKLEAVDWSSTFDPGRHEFAAAGRHLNSLSIMHSSFLGMLISSTRLLERYDTVKELEVSLGLYEKIDGYKTFLKEMDKLPICETLAISFMANHHALPATMFHLLRRCSGIRKLKLSLDQDSQPKITSCTALGCPRLMPENYRLDDITFNSLEEIGIKSFTGSDEEEEFMKLLLSKCNTVTLKRVDIMVSFDPVPSDIMEVVERIRSVCHRNSKVQFNVLPREVLNPFAS